MTAWSLSDKVILITGAARGLGATAAREMAGRGARVVLADLDADGLARMREAISPPPLTVELDVTDPVACRAAVDRAVGEHGRLDAVWANAGIASFGPMELTDSSAWRRTVEVNLLGAYYTVHAALPAVIAQRGYIAVTASMATFAHPPGMSAYAATKAGVEAMCNALRVEVAHHGVDVGTIHPIWLDTDMVREAEASQTSFRRLRQAMRPPFDRTRSVEDAVQDIVAGFEKRRRRIFAPPLMRVAHLIRPATTTRLFERDWRVAAPEITRLFEAEVAEHGPAGASVSERVGRQVGR